MNKKRIVGALIPSIIVLGLIAYLWSVNLVFFLASELSIETDIENRTFWATNGEEISLELLTRVDAPNACSTRCEFLLREVPTNITLFEETTLVGSLHRANINYMINQSTTDTLHLSYTAKCANQLSAICSTSGELYYETTFITIHHEQTPAQVQAENTIQKLLENTLLTLATTRHFLEESAQIRSSLNLSTDETLLLDLSQIELSQQVDDLSHSYEDVLSLFQRNAYGKVNQDELATLLADAQESEAQSFAIKEESSSLLKSTQSSFEILNDLISKQDVLFYVQESPATSSVQSFAEDSLRQLSSTLSRSSLKNIFSIRSFSLEVQQLQEDIETLQVFYDEAQTALISQTLNLTRYWNTSASSIQEACEVLDATKTIIQDHNSQINLTNSSLNQSTRDIILNQSSLWYENTSTNLTYGNLTPYDHRWLEDLQDIQDEYCINTTTNTTLVPLIIPHTPQVNFTFTQEEIQKQDTESCVYGICSSIDEEQPYPLILVHGHALTSVTSPEAALHSFSKIQHRLEEEGYVNVGELNDYPLKSWKEVQGPISVRASYYFLSYAELGQYQLYSKKYESIESYAIRLKEIVDEVKVKTGSDKVVILAHSMGGLVTRQYLSLFGEEDVQKAILVGTPNNGVIGASKTLCSLTGADRECEEMAQGSVFLGRLNQFIPTQTQMYTIAGVGCPKDGFDGDGVVNLNSVQLSYANNTVVEGVCTDALSSDMHQALIDPDKFPQVYERVVEILAE